MRWGYCLFPTRKTLKKVYRGRGWEEEHLGPSGLVVVAAMRMTSNTPPTARLCQTSTAASSCQPQCSSQQTWGGRAGTPGVLRPSPRFPTTPASSSPGFTLQSPGEFYNLSLGASEVAWCGTHQSINDLKVPQWLWCAFSIMLPYPVKSGVWEALVGSTPVSPAAGGLASELLVTVEARRSGF